MPFRLGAPAHSNAIALREFKLPKTAPGAPDILYDTERNAQRVPNPMSERKMMMILVEGVAFAVGLLMVGVSGYFMAVEAVRKAKRAQ